MRSDQICSISLGIIMAVIIFIFFNKNKYQQQYHGPNSNDFKTKIFELDGNCYVFKPKMYLCPN
jgi:uncharacterized membrane protein YphA (DoxX/SURF4 family)